MATFSPTPARTRLRTALLRRSWKSRPGTFAALVALAQARTKPFRRTPFSRGCACAPRPGRYGNTQSVSALRLPVRDVLGDLRLGDLQFNGSYTRNLKHEQQTYPTDPVIDLLNNGYYSRDPIWRANASLAWSKNAWTTTLYSNIIGPTGNYIAWTNLDGFDHPGGGRVGTYTTYNASVNWDMTPDVQLSFIVTNLTNKMPDMDVGSYSGLVGAPYNSDMFDVYGRAYYLEGRWNFGKAE